MATNRRRYTRGEISVITGMTIPQIKHCEKIALAKLKQKLYENQRRPK